jgi:hypothetical protein
MNYFNARHRSVSPQGRAVAIALSLALGAWLPSAPAAADDATAQALRVSTQSYAPVDGQFAPLRGTYRYDVSWQGIPAAEVTVDLKEEGDRFRITTAARTKSAIDIFYKLRYRAEGLISSFDLTPYKTFIDNRENSRQKLVQMTFLENGEIESVRSQTGKPSTVTRINTGNFTLDPFSAAFLARSLSWEKGVSRDFDTYNGKTRYLISLTAVEKVKMEVNGRSRDVWVISPTVRNLNDPKSNSKLREAKIYITADPEREILQIVSKVFIGAVTTKLVEFLPQPSSPATLQVAQQQSRRVSFRFF